MSQTRAMYFSAAKRLMLVGTDWVLTLRVANRGCLASRLNYHGYRLRAGRRWDRRGDILYSDVVRR